MHPLAPVLCFALASPVLAAHTNLAYALQQLPFAGSACVRRDFRRATSLPFIRGLHHAPGRLLRLGLFPEQGAEDLSAEAQTFLQWRLGSGVETVVTLSHFGELRGMMATKSIRKGDALLKYPRSVTMDLASHNECPCADFVDADFWKSATWFVQLALWVLAEERKGAASQWAPYINLLPRDIAVPRDWTDEELDLLAYAPLVNDIKNQQKEFGVVFDQVLPHLADGTLSLRNLSWAMSIAVQPPWHPGIALLCDLLFMLTCLTRFCRLLAKSGLPEHAAARAAGRRRGSQLAGQQGLGSDAGPFQPPSSSAPALLLRP